MDGDVIMPPSNVLVECDFLRAGRNIRATCRARSWRSSKTRIIFWNNRLSVFELKSASRRVLFSGKFGFYRFFERVLMVIFVVVASRLKRTEASLFVEDE